MARVPAVRVNKRDQRELVALDWGFLPSWWKPSQRSKSRKVFQRKCFNARQETVDTKPTFRKAFKSQRCLLPATEYIELGYYFHLKNKQPFAFAGLWEKWQSDGEVVESCTLLTTEPNEAVQKIGHHRMPVMLTDESAYSQWLNLDFVERSTFEELFRPYPAQHMEYYPAPK